VDTFLQRLSSRSLLPDNGGFSPVGRHAEASKGKSMKSLVRAALAAGIAGCLFILSGCGQKSSTDTTSSTDARSTSTTVSTATGITIAAATSQAPGSSATTTSATSTTPSKNGETLADLTPMGLPLYPNVFESGWTGGSELLQTAAIAGKSTMRVGQMSSHDSFDAVYAWYRERMPSGSETAAAAASNHTTDDGDHMAIFEVGRSTDPGYQRVWVIRGKADNYTIVNLVAHVSS
jgi:hypothetical protein